MMGAMPEQAPTKTREHALEGLAKAAKRSPVFRALLLGTTLASLQGCAGGLTAGKGPLEGMRAEGRLELEDETLPSNEEMLRRMKEAVGEDSVAGDVAAQRQYALHAKEHASEKPRLAGFEALDISPDLAEAYVRTMPRSWWDQGHLGSMTVDPQFRPIPYPGLEGKPEYGHCETSNAGEPIKIFFTSETLRPDPKRGVQLEGNKVQTVFEVALHEMAHGADWRTSQVLTPERSLAMMYMVQRASADPERPKFPYPESIQAKSGQDAKAAARIKMGEYFAELMEAGLEEKNGDDWQTWGSALARDLVTRYGATPRGAEGSVRLVKTQFQWTDPSFKPWEAARERARILDAMQEQHEYKRLSDMVSHDLPDARVSKAMGAAFEERPWTEEDVQYQIRLLLGMDESGGKLASVKPLPFEATDARVDEVVLELNSLIDATLHARANHLGYRDRFGGTYGVNLGNATVEALGANYRKLSAAQQEKFVAIALGKIAVLNGKAPEKK